MKKKSNKRKLNIVFFGRKDCNYSKKLISLLKSKSNLTTILSKKKNEIKNFDYLLKKKIDYIFCFRSFFIIRENLLNHVTHNAINFHPGTPLYRGIGCANFALVRKTKKYGSTCHLINKKIDGGRIVNVVQFKIKNINIEQLLNKTYKVMYFQAKKIIQNIFKDRSYIKKTLNKKQNFYWSKKLYKRKDLNKLYKINLSIGPEKLNKILNATIYKKFKPYIIINKRKLYLG